MHSNVVAFELFFPELKFHSCQDSSRPCALAALADILPFGMFNVRYRMLHRIVAA